MIDRLYSHLIKLGLHLKDLQAENSKLRVILNHLIGKLPEEEKQTIKKLMEE